MTVSIRKRFLHDAKERGLDAGGQTREIFGKFQRRPDPTSLGKAFHIPGSSRGKTREVERGRMEQMRQRPRL